MGVDYSLTLRSDPEEILDIIFQPRNAPWIMKITGSGKIKFNRDDYENFTEDDFAKKVIELLQELKIDRR